MDLDRLRAEQAQREALRLQGDLMDHQREQIANAKAMHKRQLDSYAEDRERAARIYEAQLARLHTQTGAAQRVADRWCDLADEIAAAARVVISSQQVSSQQNKDSQQIVDAAIELTIGWLTAKAVNDAQGDSPIFDVLMHRVTKMVEGLAAIVARVYPQRMPIIKARVVTEPHHPFDDDREDHNDRDGDDDDDDRTADDDGDDDGTR